MSAALLLNPLLGAAPADPVRPPSSADAGFAGVLATAVEGGAPPTATPGVPAMAAPGAMARGPVDAPNGKGLTNGMALEAASAIPGVIPSAGIAPAQGPVTPSASVQTLLAAPAPGEDQPPAADGAGTAATSLSPSPSFSLAPERPEPIARQAAAPAPLVADVVERLPSAPPPVPVAQTASPGATAIPEQTGAATTPARPQSLTAPASPADDVDVAAQLSSAAAPEGAPAPMPTPAPATVAASAMAAPAATPLVNLAAGTSTPVAAPTRSAGRVDASAGAPGGAVATGRVDTPVVEAANAAPAQPGAAALGGATAAAGDAVGTSPTVATAAPAGAAGPAVAPAPRPSARRTDAPATAAEGARPAAAQAPIQGQAQIPTQTQVEGFTPDALDLSAEFETGTSSLPVNSPSAFNGQPAAVAGGASSATATGAASALAGGLVGAPQAAADAAAAAAVTGTEAELSPLDGPVDMPVGEAPPLPETPPPTASTIMLQPTVNDGRFNAVAQISAQILRRLESQTTRFELALTPEDLGRVDVMLEIDGDGGVTARLAFDNPAAAAELRAQADQLRRELEAAGLTVARDGLQFAERDARRDERGTDRRGARAFAGAARLEADADADAGVGAYRISLADGRLDVRI